MPDAHPDPERLFAWAQSQAARTAARRSSSVSPLLASPEPVQERFMRLANMDDATAAKRVAEAKLADDRRQQAMIANLLAYNGVPPRYENAAFGSVDHLPVNVRKAYRDKTEDLRSLLQLPGIVVLMGPRGAGKTHMACALVNAFCAEGRQAVYAEALDYFLKLDEKINARGSVLSVEVEFLRPKLLVLDAMEERADTPAKDRMLTRLINKRYSADVSTVLVTNEDKDAFTKRVGESVADRIKDDGQLIRCEWSSLRGLIPAEVKS